MIHAAVSRLNMYEKLDVATQILHKMKVTVHGSLARAKISPKASNVIRCLRWIVTYPVDKVIRLSNNWVLVEPPMLNKLKSRDQKKSDLLVLKVGG